MTRHSRSSDTRGERRSDCPIACTLDLVGDRWTLVIVRDLLLGKRRFSEFLDSDEGIPTNILAERLKRLEAAALVERVRYQSRPPRYEYRLTNVGQDLVPVVKAVFAWGMANLSGVKGSLPTAARKRSAPGRGR